MGPAAVETAAVDGDGGRGSGVARDVDVRGTRCSWRRRSPLQLGRLGHDGRAVGVLPLGLWPDGFLLAELAIQKYLITFSAVSTGVDAS